MSEDIHLPSEGEADQPQQTLREAMEDLSQETASLIMRAGMANPDGADNTLKELAEQLSNYAKTIGKIQPFMDLIFEAYPKEAWFMFQPLQVITFPIQAYRRGNGLEDGADIEAHKGPFLEFFREYIEALERAYKERGPAFDLDTEQRKLLEVLGQQEIISEIESLSECYGLIAQGPLVREFIKARIRPGNHTLDKLTGALRIEEDGLITLIENSANLKGGLKDTTKRFLLVMLRQATGQGIQSDLVTMSLQEYMDLCGLSDSKSAREQAINDMETLYRISLSYHNGDKKRGGDFSDIRICSRQEIKNSVIYFRFGQDLFEMARAWGRMPYPTNTFKLNLKRNPNGQNLMLTLSSHKYMNEGKSNENRISILTLLAACPGIPRYETVAQENRNIAERIIEPLERDLDALVEVGALAKWHYCHSKGGALGDEELSGPWTYGFYSSLLIQFELRDGYPDQRKRIASKERYIKAAAKRKPKQRKNTKLGG